METYQCQRKSSKWNDPCTGRTDLIFLNSKQRNENTVLPATLDYRQVTGLSNEVIAKLNDHKPSSIGQASRISGITPAAISILLVWLKKQGMLRRSA